MRPPNIVLALGAIALFSNLSLAPPAASETKTAATSTRPGTREVGDLGQVGDVDFATSCDPALQKEFDRGLALLHSFFYSEARRVFAAIAEKDPECAMAHWGIAMTYYHPLWAAPDSTELAAGRAAAERAVKATKQNDRERVFVSAVHAYYTGVDDAPSAAAQPTGMSCHAPGIVDHRGRAACFKREMEKAATSRPEDMEVAAFYALSLIATAPTGDPKLENQKQATALLEKWYAAHPHHPGLVHYLIHGYDYPPIAKQGLKAAQAYASIAPEVPHALHMPSHIFTRLGMWKETIQSNLASAEASRKYGAEHHPDAVASEELHALDYALYGYLQTSQDAKAKEVVARLASVEKTSPPVDFAAAYAFGAMPARYALERRQWKEAAALETRSMPFLEGMLFAEGHVAYARAIGAARSGDLALARTSAARLKELASAGTEPRFKYFADHMQLQSEAALALVTFAEGRKEESIAMLRRAAAREDSLGKHPVSPGAMLPVRELLAETLLEAGKAKEALAEFDLSLKLNPGRFNGLYGAARAATAAGEKDRSKKLYRDLTELASAGDGTRPEIAEAKKVMAGR